MKSTNLSRPLRASPALPESKIDRLVRAGLSPSRDQDFLYKKAIEDVLSGTSSSQYDNLYYPKIISSLKSILKIVLSDQRIFDSVFADMLSKKSRVRLEDVEALRLKSTKSGIELETLVEVFRRGLEENGKKIPRLENAYNRVNSFVAGGKAREIDADVATKSIKESTTTSIIQKILREKRKCKTK